MGFHLRTGQWIWQNHAFPSQDNYTYTAFGHDYLDMENLYQVALYALYQLGGYSLLSIAHIGLALLAFFLVWMRIRSIQAPWGIAVLLFAFAVLASESRVRVRPEILSWVLLSLTLWILELRADQKKNLLFLLPFIQWIWVNTEGLFFIGWGVMGIYLLSGFFPRSQRDPKLFKYFGLSLAVSLLNPHFFRGFLFPFSFLTTLHSSEIYQAAAQEFQNPWSLDSSTSYLWAYKFFSILLFFLLILSFRRRKAQDWLLTLFFFALSVVAIRNIPLFMIGILPLATLSWKEAEAAWLQKFQERVLGKPWAAAILLLFLIGFSARVVTNVHYVSDHLSDRFGLGLDLETVPDRACGFLTQNHLNGTLLNTLDAGDWLDWKTPQKTFLDGRLDVMGSNLLKDYYDSFQQGGLQRLIAQYHPEILFFNPLYAVAWMTDLAQQTDWRLVYLDECTAVYLRKGYADWIPNLDTKELLAERGIASDILTQAPALLSLEPPSFGQCLMEDFVRPSTYSNGLLNLGIFTTYCREPAVAESCLLEAIRRSQGRYTDDYYNLGCVYDEYGNPSGALACMKRVLKDQPQNPIALQVTRSLSPNLITN